jgi:hypothetical protein
MGPHHEGAVDSDEWLGISSRKMLTGESDAKCRSIRSLITALETVISKCPWVTGLAS